MPLNKPKKKPTRFFLFPKLKINCKGRIWKYWGYQKIQCCCFTKKKKKKKRKRKRKKGKDFQKCFLQWKICWNKRGDDYLINTGCFTIVETKQQTLESFLLTILFSDYCWERVNIFIYLTKYNKIMPWTMG